MPWWLADRGQPRQGKRQSQAAKQPDPPSWECNAGITKIKAQEGKGEPDTRLCVLDTVDGHAQPGQYGCHHCRLGHGSARPFWLPGIFETCAFPWRSRIEGRPSDKPIYARALLRRHGSGTPQRPSTRPQDAAVVRIWLGVFPVHRLNACVNALTSLKPSM
jgi:hypothetical protein